MNYILAKKEELVALGINNFGEEFLKNISSFIYPRYPLRNPLDEIAKIKFRIESGSDKANNIK